VATRQLEIFQPGESNILVVTFDEVFINIFLTLVPSSEKLQIAYMLQGLSLLNPQNLSSWNQLSAALDAPNHAAEALLLPFVGHLAGAHRGGSSGSAHGPSKTDAMFGYVINQGFTNVPPR